MSEKKISHEDHVAFRLAVVRAIAKQGGGARLRRDIAKWIGVSEGTVRRWEQRVREGKPVYEKRGPKSGEVPRERRQQLLEAMIRLGPCAGVPTLRGMFKDVPYRLIGRMKQRLNRVVGRRWRWYRKKLTWLRAGAVWARASFSAARRCNVLAPMSSIPRFTIRLFEASSARFRALRAKI